LAPSVSTQYPVLPNFVVIKNKSIVLS